MVLFLIVDIFYHIGISVMEYVNAPYPSAQPFQSENAILDVISTYM